MFRYFSEKLDLYLPFSDVSLGGFTLVEIMIVVAIIAMLAALAIPNLLRAKLGANESAAEASLRTLSTAAQTYRAVNPAYPAGLSNLTADTPPYIDAVLGAGTKQGYIFLITSTSNTYAATARPQVYNSSGSRSFFVDESGVIRYTAADTSATVNDTPITP